MSHHLFVTWIHKLYSHKSEFHQEFMNIYVFHSHSQLHSVRNIFHVMQNWSTFKGTIDLLTFSVVPILILSCHFLEVAVVLVSWLYEIYSLVNIKQWGTGTVKSVSSCSSDGVKLTTHSEFTDGETFCFMHHLAFSATICSDSLLVTHTKIQITKKSH
jgi:hypothetical protein